MKVRSSFDESGLTQIFLQQSVTVRGQLTKHCRYCTAGDGAYFVIGKNGHAVKMQSVAAKAEWSSSN